LPGNTIKIVAPLSGKILERGELGEIAVKGPTLMLGYLGLPPEESFDAEGFYRSGDAGWIDAAGRLHFEGRLSTVIKTGGANVSPLEIDQVLETMPGVKIARCVGIPDDSLGELVVGCIVPAEGVVLNAEGIRAFARSRLASYKVPRRIVFFQETELQLTGSAKVKPAQLRARALHKIAADEPEDPIR
jgi:acyl-CoA synthetase (AMP-forming)/AMP-acid ligase II